MRNTFTVIVREMGAYFRSPIGFVVPVLFWTISGLRFYLDVVGSAGALDAAFGQLMGGTQFWMLSFLLIPAITMRLIAEERRAGTLEMTLTAPVDEGELVWGKFLGALVFYAFLWLPLFLYIAIVLFLGGSPDLGRIVANLFGVLLLGAMFLAVGLFCSSVTSNQIIAAVFTAVVLLGISFLPEVARLFPRVAVVQRIADYVSFFRHFGEFQSGVIDARPAIYYLTTTGFFLFLTARSLEARKWQ